MMKAEAVSDVPLSSNIDASKASKAAKYFSDELKKQLKTLVKGVPCYSDADVDRIALHFSNMMMTEAICSKYAEFIETYPEIAADLLIGKIDPASTPLKATGLTQIMHETGKKYSSGFFSGACSSQSANVGHALFQFNAAALSGKAFNLKELQIKNFIDQTLDGVGIKYTKEKLPLDEAAEAFLKGQDFQEGIVDGIKLVIRRTSIALATRHSLARVEKVGIVKQFYSPLCTLDRGRLHQFFFDEIMPDVLQQLQPWERDILSEYPANWAAIIGGEKVSEKIKKGWLGGIYPDFKFTQLMDFSFKHLVQPTQPTESVTTMGDLETSYYQLKTEAELLTYKQSLIDNILERSQTACKILKPLYIADASANDPSFDDAAWLGRVNAPVHGLV